MTATVPVLTVADCFRNDGRMQDWERLGSYVVARRVELGYKQRADFAAALQISTRVVGDIEKGRRGNFDPVTIASLESVLGWETGSALRVARGGEPSLRSKPTDTDNDDEGFAPADYGKDEALVRVMRSSLPAARKRQLVRMLLVEREQAERRRVEHAEELIRLVGDEA